MAYSRLQVFFLSPKCLGGAVCALGDDGAAAGPDVYGAALYSQC